jgi:hypothetical protein
MIRFILWPLELAATAVLTILIFGAAVLREAIGNRWSGS